MPKKPKSLFPLNIRTGTGVLISVFFAIIIAIAPTPLKADAPTAFVIALIGICITLLFEYNLKMESIAHTNELAEHLRRDPELSSRMKKILDDGIKVKQNQPDVFIKRMTSTLEDCGRIIHTLSEGELKADPTQTDVFRLNGVFIEGNRNVYIIQGYDPAYMFKGVFKTNYQEALRKGVSLNINIQIIWIQPSNVLTTHKDDILEQASIVSGTGPMRQHVAVVEHKPNDYIEYEYQDFGLVDKKILYFPQSPGYVTERLSTKTEEINHAKDLFERIWTMATPVDVYYNLQEYSQPSPPSQTLSQQSTPSTTAISNPPPTH